MRLLVYAILLCMAWPAAADKPLAPEYLPGATVVDAAQVVELIQNTPALIVIDARLPDEYAKGHIPGALNLLDNHMTEARMHHIAANLGTPLLFYCNGVHCMRSGNAVRQAAAWGYRTIYWFRTGWQEWLEQELPVAR